MHLDEKKQIIYQRVEGPLDTEDSKKIFEMVVEFKKKLLDPDKIRILAFSDTTEKPTPEARRMLIEHEKRDDLYKLAVVGKNPYMRTVLSFFLMVSGSKKVRMFTTEADALIWLDK
jgi:hypothetical protein